MAVAAPSLVYANNFNYNAFQVRLGADPGTVGAEFTTFFTENTHFILRGDSRFEGDWDVAGGIGFNGPAGQFADVYGQLLVHNIKTKSTISGIQTSHLSLISALVFGSFKMWKVMLELVCLTGMMILNSFGKWAHVSIQQTCFHSVPPYLTTEPTETKSKCLLHLTSSFLYRKMAFRLESHFLLPVTWIIYCLV